MAYKLSVFLPGVLLHVDAHIAPYKYWFHDPLVNPAWWSSYDASYNMGQSRQRCKYAVSQCMSGKTEGFTSVGIVDTSQTTWQGEATDGRAFIQTPLCIQRTFGWLGESTNYLKRKFCLQSVKYYWNITGEMNEDNAEEACNGQVRVANKDKDYCAWLNHDKYWNTYRAWMMDYARWDPEVADNFYRAVYACRKPKFEPNSEDLSITLQTPHCKPAYFSSEMNGGPQACIARVIHYWPMGYETHMHSPGYYKPNPEWKKGSELKKYIVADKTKGMTRYNCEYSKDYGFWENSDLYGFANYRKSWR